MICVRTTIAFFLSMVCLPHVWWQMFVNVTLIYFFIPFTGIKASATNHFSQEYVCICFFLSKWSIVSYFYDCFTCTRVIMRLSPCQCINPEGYGLNRTVPTQTKLQQSANRGHNCCEIIKVKDCLQYFPLKLKWGRSPVTWIMRRLPSIAGNWIERYPSSMQEL